MVIAELLVLLNFLKEKSYKVTPSHLLKRPMVDVLTVLVAMSWPMCCL